MEIKAPEVSFNFGPSILMEEKSRLTGGEDALNIRRDRLGWLGFQFNKILEVDHLRYEAQLGFRRKIIGQELSQGTESFNASNAYISTKVNLSRDYDFAVKFNTTNYDNIGIKREQSIGANFSYNLK